MYFIFVELKKIKKTRICKNIFQIIQIKKINLNHSFCVKNKLK